MYGDAYSTFSRNRYQSFGSEEGMMPKVVGAGFVRQPRKSLNGVAIALCIIIPVLMFAAISWVMSYRIKSFQTSVTYMMAAFTFLPIAICGGVVAESRLRRSGYTEGTRAPSWLTFLFLALLVAWLSGFMAGVRNYNSHIVAYREMMSLSTYVNIDPSWTRSKQLMDAGIVSFKFGSRVDVLKSMHFKNDNMYCVAPMTFGNATLMTYDFWMVGKDCCSGVKTEFHCFGHTDIRNRGGLRLLNDADRPFYRLAVQQAEATHNISASHPLFFTPSRDGKEEVESWMTTANRYYAAGIVVYFLIHTLIVFTMTLAFAKMGD